MVPPTELSSYPRPSVAVDVAVLTTVPPALDAQHPGALAVLVVAAGQLRALPGRFLRDHQTVAACVRDALEIKAGLGDIRVHPRLLRVFDDPRRDPRGWTLSLGHALVLPARRLERSTGTLVAISATGRLETGESLQFDHDVIVAEAATLLRERYERLPDPDGLLDHPFTIAELRSVHEAVLGVRLLKDTFRRRMEPCLRPARQPDGSPVLHSDGGRPAQVYTRDSDVPLTPAAQRRLLLPRAGG